MVAGGVEVDYCSAKCQWYGLNYSTLSIYSPSILTEFLKLRKDDEIKIKDSVFNRLNIKTKRYFLSFRVDSFEIIQKAIRKRANTNTNIKKWEEKTMALKNVKYVIIDENNKPIKNEDGSFDIKTAEIILENTSEVEKFNSSNLEIGRM